MHETPDKDYASPFKTDHALCNGNIIDRRNADFDIPMTLTTRFGEPSKSLMTMVLYLYNMAFKNNDLPYGATISYGIFVIIISSL